MPRPQNHQRSRLNNWIIKVNYTIESIVKILFIFSKIMLLQIRSMVIRQQLSRKRKANYVMPARSQMTKAWSKPKGMGFRAKCKIRKTLNFMINLVRQWNQSRTWVWTLTLDREELNPPRPDQSPRASFASRIRDFTDHLTPKSFLRLLQNSTKVKSWTRLRPKTDKLSKISKCKLLRK